MAPSILLNYYLINSLSIHIKIYEIFFGQFNSVPRKSNVQLNRYLLYFKLGLILFFVYSLKKLCLFNLPLIMVRAKP